MRLLHRLGCLAALNSYLKPCFLSNSLYAIFSELFPISIHYLMLNGIFYLNQNNKGL